MKPFGICINGCIDGFSRKIIWMNAFTTSSDPKIVGGYYIEAVEKLGGCPRIVRGDKGTENVKVRDVQRFVRRNIQDGSAIDSYIEGASTANLQMVLCYRSMKTGPTVGLKDSTPVELEHHGCRAESCWICLPSKCQGLHLHHRYPCEVPLVDSALGKVQAGSPLSYEHHHDS
ncbi:hypothetical protein F7725_004149 [Dissostichus mawsoni]|uniref:Integrase core domain-containing protein n=1 Tax=Dissostichus mawsoni TaxID=36200 RepID=A0A7J5XHW7_DISMA|nr:hypothetical protein F7725_004149 [Dissostichus mawsoni]